MKCNHRAYGAVGQILDSHEPHTLVHFSHVHVHFGRYEYLSLAKPLGDLVSRDVQYFLRKDIWNRREYMLQWLPPGTAPATVYKAHQV